MVRFLKEEALISQKSANILRLTTLQKLMLLIANAASCLIVFKNNRIQIVLEERPELSLCCRNRILKITRLENVHSINWIQT